MAARSTVNLIPEQIKKEQASAKLVKSSTLFTILLLTAVAAASGFLIYRTNKMNTEMDLLDNDIADARSKISTMEDIEIVARSLDTKFKTLSGILANRRHYSTLMDELNKRVPDNVTIETFSTGKENTINISGRGSDYISIAKLVSNLFDKEFPESGKDLGALFTDVTLNSVNLDAQTSSAKFFIVVTVDPELLRN